MTRAAMIATVAVLGLVGGGVAAFGKAPNGGPPHDDGGFEISGSVDGLLPFVGRTLSVTVENPRSFTVDVDSLDITIDDASPACTAANVTVGQVDVPFAVPARGERSVTVPIALIDDASDACQSATFGITYVGTATKSPRSGLGPGPEG